MLDWMCLDNSHYCKGESFYKNQNSWGLQSPLILKTQHAFTTSIMNQHILMIQKDTSFLFFKKKDLFKSDIVRWIDSVVWLTALFQIQQMIYVQNVSVDFPIIYKYGARANPIEFWLESPWYPWMEMILYYFHGVCFLIIGLWYNWIIDGHIHFLLKPVLLLLSTILSC